MHGRRRRRCRDDTGDRDDHDDHDDHDDPSSSTPASKRRFDGQPARPTGSSSQVPALSAPPNWERRRRHGTEELDRRQYISSALRQSMPVKDVLSIVLEYSWQQHLFYISAGNLVKYDPMTHQCTLIGSPVGAPSYGSLGQVDAHHFMLLPVQSTGLAILYNTLTGKWSERRIDPTRPWDVERFYPRDFVWQVNDHMFRVPHMDRRAGYGHSLHFNEHCSQTGQFQRQHRLPWPYVGQSVWILRVIQQAQASECIWMELCSDGKFTYHAALHDGDGWVVVESEAISTTGGAVPSIVFNRRLYVFECGQHVHVYEQQTQQWRRYPVFYDGSYIRTRCNCLAVVDGQLLALTYTSEVIRYRLSKRDGSIESSTRVLAMFPHCSTANVLGM